MFSSMKYRLALAFLMSLLGCPLMVHGQPAEGRPTDVPIAEAVPDIAYGSHRWSDDGSELEYSGPIDDDFLALVRQGGETLSVLKVSSLGGSIDSAKEIHSIAEENGVRLVFSKYCVSACAYYLLIVSSKATIEPNTLVAFHHSDFSLGARMARTSLMSKEEYENDVAWRVRVDVAFFREAGINPRMAYIPDYENNPICVGRKLRKDNVGRWMIYYINEYDYWVPSYELIVDINSTIDALVEYYVESALGVLMLDFPNTRHLKFNIVEKMGDGIGGEDIWMKLPYCGLRRILERQSQRSRIYGN